jgi:hypothetical protein
VQADHAAVRVFGQWLQRQQLLRMRERIGVVLRAFGPLAEFDQALADARAAPVALLREPEAEGPADLVAAAAEHAIGIVQIMVHAGGQGECAAATHDLGTGLPAQLEDALTQRVARAV